MAWIFAIIYSLMAIILTFVYINLMNNILKYISNGHHYKKKEMGQIIGEISHCTKKVSQCKEELAGCREEITECRNEIAECKSSLYSVINRTIPPCQNHEVSSTNFNDYPQSINRTRSRWMQSSNGQNIVYGGVTSPLPVSQDIPVERKPMSSCDEDFEPVSSMMAKVCELNESSPLYFRFNVSTSRFDLVNKENAQYVVMNNYYVLPNHTNTFKVTDLNPAVYDYGNMTIVKANNSIKYCKIDGDYNIVCKGIIK